MAPPETREAERRGGAAHEPAYVAADRDVVHREGEREVEDDDRERAAAEDVVALPRDEQTRDDARALVADALDSADDASRSLRAPRVLRTADTDRGRRHAFGADRPPALRARKPGDAVRVPVARALRGFRHVRLA